MTTTTCAAGQSPDGTCLSAVQKAALAKMFAGPKNSAGKALYSDWPWTNGIYGSSWRGYKTGTSNGAGTGTSKYGNNVGFVSAAAYIFSTPPADPKVVTGLGATLIDWTLSYDFDKAESLINGTTAVFTESSMSLMTPPNPTDLSTLRDRGAKLIVFHGTADPVFSYNDTIAWYKALAGANNGDASQLRASVQHRRHDPHAGRAVDRSVRPRDGPGRLGREGPGSRQRDRHDADHHAEPGPGQRRHSGRSHSPAVCLPEVREIQGHRQHRRRGELLLSVMLPLPLSAGYLSISGEPS